MENDSERYGDIFSRCLRFAEESQPNMRKNKIKGNIHSKP